MNRFFYGNFDFEEQLRGEVQRSARVERLVLELASSWLAIADVGDRIWCPGRLPVEFLASLEQWGLPADIFVAEESHIPAGMELVPWGWSPTAVEFGQRNGLVVKSPPVDVVQLANSREYSVSMEEVADEDPKFATLCLTWEQVWACVQSLSYDNRWVIKANWSHAARERILGRGPYIIGPDFSWIQQRLARDGVVCWERWLQRESELGIQWHITLGQSPQLIAVTELLVDARGQYIGTRAYPAPEMPNTLPHWVQPAVHATLPTVTDLARRGYFGPVGIDAMRYFDPESNSSRTRPLQDINARWTMGRLAAGWIERLGRPATWRHGRWETQADDESGTRSVSTSPERINGSPVTHRMWLSNSREQSDRSVTS